MASLPWPKVNADNRRGSTRPTMVQMEFTSQGSNGSKLRYTNPPGNSSSKLGSRHRNRKLSRNSYTAWAQACSCVVVNDAVACTSPFENDTTQRTRLSSTAAGLSHSAPWKNTIKVYNANVTEPSWSNCFCLFRARYFFFLCVLRLRWCFF